MDILLNAFAGFITEHYILTFLLLISIFKVRIDIGKKKSSKKEPKQLTEEDIEIIERDNNIPPEESLLAKKKPL